MSQHYLLSPESKTLSLMDIINMSEMEVFNFFKSLRWKETKGKPVCSHCGSKGFHYFLSTRKIWKCCDCRKQFSLTSGTIFAYHKLPLKTYLLAIAIYTNGAKGYSALQLSRDIKVKYQTAFVLVHKIRESLMNHRNLEMMEGVVEIDVSYIGGKVKQENRKEDRIDRRKLENQSGKKRAIVTIRQRNSERKKGAIRTLSFILKSENYNDLKKIVQKFVSKESIIHADESTAYDLLHAKYTMKRVNHSIEFFNSKTKACTNQVESFFSRLKRAYIGIYHKMNPTYLPYYVNEIAYKEDHRRVSNGNICEDILFKALHSSMSLELCGYWQGNHRRFERLGV